MARNRITFSANENTLQSWAESPRLKNLIEEAIRVWEQRVPKNAGARLSIDGRGA